MDFAYWTYHVYTKTTLETFSQKELVCVRRYNDFVWLRDQLVETYQGVIVPPIPEKSIKGSLEKVLSVNANPLLEYRQRALRKFLVRVGAHPILCTSDLLREFLELNPEEFQKRKDAPKKKADVNIGQRFKELSFTVTKSFATPGGAPAAGGTAAVPEVEEQSTAARALDTNWEETKNYIDQLERSLVLLKERIELLVKRRRDTSVSLSEFGKSFVKIGEIESSYEEGSLPKALIDVGHHSEHLSIVYQEQADNETIQVVETILYYIGLTMAVRDSIKKIQKLALTRDTIDDSLVKLQEKRAKLAGKEEELRKLDLEINNTNQRKEEAQQAVQVVENTFREELRRFHREKQYDIKQMLKAFVDLQLEYAAKMKTSWESVLPSVEAIKTD